MDVSFNEVMKSLSPGLVKTGCLQIESSFSAYDTVTLEKGFFFLLVINGTSSVNDIYHTYTLSARQLLVVTPSVQVRLTGKSEDFRCICLYIVPDYFDTLAVGQLAYNQVSSYIGNFRLPIFQLDKAQTEYLQKTMALFTTQLEKMQL